MRRTLLIFFIAACSWQQAVYGTPQRSRAEGLPGVEASNTVGLGDIWVETGTEARFEIDPVPRETLLGLADSAYRSELSGLVGTGRQLRREMRLLPRVQAVLGLAHFLQLKVEGIPWDGQKLGTTTAWLKCTLPGNDNLRLFGVSVALGTTLSSEEDVYSRSTTTPGFEPIFHVQAVADADFIRYSASFPLKLYLNYDNFEDERLIHAYGQNKFQVAAEWKGFRGGPYVRWATYLYRNLPTVFDPDPAQTWKPLFHEAALGMRWMAGDHFTFTAEFSMDPVAPLAFYSDAARKPPQLRADVSVPLIAQETQAEALRALIFTENARRKLRLAAARKPSGGATTDSAKTVATGGLPVDLDALSLDKNTQDPKAAELLNNILGDKEKEILDRRQKIRAELKEIEDLLE